MSSLSGLNFYPRPPRGGRPSVLGTIVGWVSFLSTPSARRATPNWDIIHEALKISIHALREEGDHRRGAGCHNGGAISIHALRRADRYARREISIHALREEGDGLGQGKTSLAPAISIHALREEGDQRRHYDIQLCLLFLSTPSARRATHTITVEVSDGKISIHALREEGDEATVYVYPYRDISIHALREEGDAYWQRWIRKEGLFLSTPSARRATPCHPADDVLQRISIHALREEGDLRG